MEFKEIVNKRYAVKKFTEEKVLESKIHELFELIRAAPTSFNIQPYVVKVVKDQKTKEMLFPFAWNQPQITSCSHLLVFCANTDVAGCIDKLEKQIDESSSSSDATRAYVKMMRDFESKLTEEQKLSWAQRQTFLPFGNALNGAISLGFDSSPMEGFNPKEFARILKLENNLVPTALCAIGYATDKPKEKTRFPLKEIFID